MEYDSTWKQRLQDKTSDDMTHCGLAIIVANRNARDLTQLPDSVHTTAETVKGALRNLRFAILHKDGFEVTDPEELKAVVRQTAGMTYPNNYKVIIFYFIGHGRIGEDGKHGLCTKGGDVEVGDEVLFPFQPDQSPDIANTPKLFLFDCCHGPRQDEGVLVPMGPNSRDAKEGVNMVLGYTKRPSIGNAFVAYAAAPPFQSQCHRDEGPLWTSFLLKQLPKDQSIYDVLHRTNTALMGQYDIWMRDPEKKKEIWGPDPCPILVQQPMFLSTLHGDPILNLYQIAGLSHWQQIVHLASHPPPFKVQPSSSSAMQTPPSLKAQPTPPFKVQPPPPSMMQPPPQRQLVPYEKRTARGLTAQSFVRFPEPELRDLVDFIGTDLKAYWRIIGQQLGIKDGDIAGIPMDSLNLGGDSPMNCLTQVFIKWRDAQTSDYSWKQLVKVLLADALNRPTVVDNLYDKLRQKYPQRCA